VVQGSSGACNSTTKRRGFIVITGQPEASIRRELSGIAVPHLLRKPLTVEDLAACLAPRAP
jgi:hypothetical protein